MSAWGIVNGRARKTSTGTDFVCSVSLWRKPPQRFKYRGSRNDETASRIDPTDADIVWRPARSMCIGAATAAEGLHVETFAMETMRPRRASMGGSMETIDVSLTAFWAYRE